MLAAMLLAGTNVSAQVLYSCDFENPAENANWTLNKTSNARPLSGYNNIWFIGPEGNCAGGTAGLYIAPQADSTQNVAVPVTGPVDFVVAYRDTINLGAPGTYTLAFDWRCAGKSTDMMSVFWFPDSYTQNTNSNYGAASLPNAWTPYKIADFRGSPIWQSYYNATFTFDLARVPEELVRFEETPHAGKRALDRERHKYLPVPPLGAAWRVRHARDGVVPLAVEVRPVLANHLRAGILAPGVFRGDFFSERSHHRSRDNQTDHLRPSFPCCLSGEPTRDTPMPIL